MPRRRRPASPSRARAAASCGAAAVELWSGSSTCSLCRRCRVCIACVRRRPCAAAPPRARARSARASASSAPGACRAAPRARRPRAARRGARRRAARRRCSSAAHSSAAPGDGARPAECLWCSRRICRRRLRRRARRPRVHEHLGVRDALRRAALEDAVRRARLLVEEQARRGGVEECHICASPTARGREPRDPRAAGSRCRNHAARRRIRHHNTEIERTAHTDGPSRLPERTLAAPAPPPLTLCSRQTAQHKLRSVAPASAASSHDGAIAATGDRGGPADALGHGDGRARRAVRRCFAGARDRLLAGCSRRRRASAKDGATVWAVADARACTTSTQRTSTRRRSRLTHCGRWAAASRLSGGGGGGSVLVRDASTGAARHHLRCPTAVVQVLVAGRRLWRATRAGPHHALRCGDGRVHRPRR